MKIINEYKVEFDRRISNMSAEHKIVCKCNKIKTTIICNLNK